MSSDSELDPDAAVFLRELLNLKPDAAAEVREDPAKVMERENRQRVEDAESDPSDAPTDDPRRPSNPA